MSIFISIASYLDPTLPKTIMRALKNADNPDELYFGLGLQYYNEPDLSGLPTKNIKTISWHPDTRPGIVKIRYEISRLFENQDYFLMLDSHMDFRPGWDTEIVSVLKGLQEKHGTYKIGLFPLGTYGDEAMSSYFRMQLDQAPDFPFFINSIPMNGRYVPTSKLEKISYMRVGQIFFDGRFITEVGLDPRSHYEQEQAYLGYRAYMAGWDIYQYHEELMLHLGNDPEYLEAVSGLEKSWGTTEEVENCQRDMTMAYLYNIGPYAIKDAERTPIDYWTYNKSRYTYLLACSIFETKKEYADYMKEYVDE
jgi:hypothetical protein